MAPSPELLKNPSGHPSLPLGSSLGPLDNFQTSLRKVLRLTSKVVARLGLQDLSNKFQGPPKPFQGPEEQARYIQR